MPLIVVTVPVVIMLTGVYFQSLLEYTWSGAPMTSGLAGSDIEKSLTIILNDAATPGEEHCL